LLLLRCYVVVVFTFVVVVTRLPTVVVYVCTLLRLRLRLHVDTVGIVVVVVDYLRLLFTLFHIVTLFDLLLFRLRDLIVILFIVVVVVDFTFHVYVTLRCLCVVAHCCHVPFVVSLLRPLRYVVVTFGVHSGRSRSYVR